MGIDVEKRGHVLTITMNRPEAMNALDLAALDSLASAWEAGDRDDEVRVLVITGAGQKSFSVGADLKNFAPQETPLALRHPAFFPTTNKPIVALVNGYCLAGGCELLGATDIRLAAEHAVFSITEAKLGLFPAGGSAARFPRQLTWARAMELMITGLHVSAHDAWHWGLVNRVVSADALKSDGYALADKIAALSPVSVRSIKEAAKMSMTMSLDAALEAQASFTRRVVGSEDAREGPKAFLEGRAPKFKGC